MNKKVRVSPELLASGEPMINMLFDNLKRRGWKGETLIVTWAGADEARADGLSDYA